VVGVVVVTVLSSLRSLRAVSHQASMLSLNRLDERLQARNLPGSSSRWFRQSTPRSIGSKRTIACRGNSPPTPRTSCVPRLRRCEHGSSRAFRREKLGDVALEIEQLARLVEQLLCLARLDSQEQFQFAAFDAHAVALEVARELAPAALESEHYVTAATPDASVRAHGNATLTRLVFRNLIENAIQYTPAGTSITLSADSARTVIIADDGPGIAAHAHCVPVRAVSPRPRCLGARRGLGLAIAKCIMERQGGSLSLDANAARGARFVMTFPEPAYFDCVSAPPA
jgi:two-component system, OmpR family, sensor histidine kinase TctE